MSLRDALSDPNSLILAVGPGGQPGEVVQVRVSLEAAPELDQLLKDEGVHGGYVVMESADAPVLAMLLASFAGAGGLHGVAAVMRAFINRHQHRSITFVHRGQPIELKGMSQKDMETLIDGAIQEAADRQRENLERFDYRFPNEIEDSEE